MDEREDEKSTHVDEKRTEGKESGRNRGGGTNELLFSHLSTNLRIKSKSDDEKKYTKKRNRGLNFILFYYFFCLLKLGSK